MRTVDQTISDDWRDRELDAHFDAEQATPQELAAARAEYALELRHVDLPDEVPRRWAFVR